MGLKVICFMGEYALKAGEFSGAPLYPVAAWVEGQRCIHVQQLH